jgi:hypothetical protein
MAKTLAEFEAEQKAKEETPQVQTPPAEGQAVVKEPEVKESVVIIDGKERPLKNYESEIRRKIEEEYEIKSREKEEIQRSIQSQQSHQPINYAELFAQEGEQEMALSGKAVPVNTIMKMANAISQRNLEMTLKSKDNAEREVRSFKRSVRKEPDFNDLEDEFDNLVDQLPADRVNSPTLEIIMNSIRGKKYNELMRKAKEDGKKEAIKDTQILGSPVDVTSGTFTPKSSLTSEQKTELDRMNQSNTMPLTEEDYKSSLIKKQNRFKQEGAKNTPTLLSDSIIK